MARRFSTTTRDSSSQPRSTAAFTAEYSPDTLYAANGSKLTYGPVKLDENGTLFRVNITGGNAPITSQSARLTVRLQQNLAEFQHGLKAFYPFKE